jgi:magnesium transporter
VPATLMASEGESSVTLDRADLEQVRRRPDFVWLDVHRPTEEELDVVAEVFGLHPLVVEDAKRFGQRPRLDEYEGYVALIVYGAAPDDPDDLVEVHALYSERSLITIRRDECPAFETARGRFAQHHFEVEHPIALLYRVLDGLVDSFFPVLSEIDDRIDALSDAIVARPTDAQLQETFGLKRRLVSLRKVIGPERDLFAKFASGAVTLPGLTAEADRYFRDLYDHLIRLVESVDSYRDLLTSTMDVYLSTVSNRLNGVMKQLTVIATIFLPLTFVTGFFGQNFAWMVENVGGLGWFLGLGIGAQVVAAAALLVFFRKRGWF